MNPYQIRMGHGDRSAFAPSPASIAALNGVLAASWRVIESERARCLAILDADPEDRRLLDSIGPSAWRIHARAEVLALMRDYTQLLGALAREPARPGEAQDLPQVRAALQELGLWP